jgi:hypothetical protein
MATKQLIFISLLLVTTLSNAAGISNLFNDLVKKPVPADQNTQRPQAPQAPTTPKSIPTPVKK